MFHEMSEHIAATKIPKSMKSTSEVPRLIAGVNMNDRLPEDVLIEILAYLPVKPLLRFKCVSRSWGALIKSPTFITCHLNHQNRGVIMLLNHFVLRDENGDGEDGIISFHNPDSMDLLMCPDLLIPSPENFPGGPGEPLFPLLLLYGPCNGIICIKYGGTMFLCNPSLREFKLLPDCPFPCPEGYYILSAEASGFGFDPRMFFCNPSLGEFKVFPVCPFPRPEVYYRLHVEASGFGFDPRTNTYKFVEIYSIHEGDPNEEGLSVPPRWRVCLFDSSTNLWRPIDTSMVPRVISQYGSGCFFKGTVHWATICPEGFSSDSIVVSDMNTEALDAFGKPIRCIGSILCFNMSTEVFWEFAFPDWDDGKVSTLMVLNESLAAVRHRGHFSTEARLIDIWMMKDYGVSESWTKQYVIGPYLFHQAFFCWKSEWLVVETKDGRLAACAFHTNEMRRFQFHINKIRRFQSSLMTGSFHSMLYKESLISVDDLIFGLQQ